jgi:hypothetical protein
MLMHCNPVTLCGDLRMELASSQSKKRDYAQFLECKPAASNQNMNPPVGSTEQNELCARCRAIDLDKIFQVKIRTYRGSLVADLGKSVGNLRASDCMMCRLFGSISPSDTDENGSARRQSCHLRAFSANRVFSNISPSKMGDLQDTTLLAVARGNIVDDSGYRANSSSNLRACLDETGSLFSIHENQRQLVLGVRLLSQTSFNLQFAINCLTYCLANHLQTCSPIESSLVESLRVIDCRTQTIIRAPSGCNYVALLYVWGCPTSSNTSAVDQNFLSIQNAPKVINDAIEVTLKLGLQYLWIDRYCIDQSNKEDKHNTIQVMDLIYANARLTIIAAAGETPDHGLPGV